MKSTKLYDINLKEMRVNVRAKLTEKAQHVAEVIAEVISGSITEAYSDNPFSKEDKIPYYSKEDVRAMLQKIETPNKNDDNFEDNMNNDVHSSKEGIDKLKNSDTNKKDIGSGGGNQIDVKEPNYDRNNSIRLMRDTYFQESDEDIHYIDYSDDSSEDEEEFRNALIHAQAVNQVIVISLDDGNELDLDAEYINKILASDSLFVGVLKSFESLATITSILGINMPEEDGTHDVDGYLEESEKDDVLLDKTYFGESVTDYLENLMPEAMYIMAEDMFSQSPKDFDSVAQKLEESAGNNRNRIERGRAVMVNRVRGGQLQLRKLVSNSKGYKIVAGSAVRMRPAEIKKRRISGRFASKKRRNMQSRINRQTKLSLRFRARRLGTKE